MPKPTTPEKCSIIYLLANCLTFEGKYNGCIDFSEPRVYSEDWMGSLLCGMSRVERHNSVRRGVQFKGHIPEILCKIWIRRHRQIECQITRIPKMSVECQSHQMGEWTGDSNKLIFKEWKYFNYILHRHQTRSKKIQSNWQISGSSEIFVWCFQR